jgi:hypothetical protein
MIWMWLPIVIILVGAEINAEVEHQTARDTTSGQEIRMGTRGDCWPMKSDAHGLVSCRDGKAFSLAGMIEFGGRLSVRREDQWPCWPRGKYT